MIVRHSSWITRLRSTHYSSCIIGTSVALIWMLAFLSALPNFSMHQLRFLPTSQTWKCEKISSKYIDERLYMILIVGKVVFCPRLFKLITQKCTFAALVLYFLMPAISMMSLYTSLICKMIQKSATAPMKWKRSREIHLPLLVREYLLHPKVCFLYTKSSFEEKRSY